MPIIHQGVIRGSQNLTRTWDSKGDSISKTWKSIWDEEQDDPVTVYIASQLYVDDPVPAEGANYHPVLAPYLYAKKATVKPFSASNLKIWTIQVSFEPAEDEEDEDIGLNPLDRPAKFNVEYIETAYEVEFGTLLTAGLNHANGSGGSLAKDTFGPIVNAAGKRFDEPLQETERNAVLIIERNYADLSEIVDLNEKFQRTTNSGPYLGFPAETLKYMVTDSSGIQMEVIKTFAGDVKQSFYTGTTRIEKKKTTQKELVNQGYAYWDSEEGKIVDDKKTAKDLENLALDGTREGGNTSIKYRYLDLKDYSTITSL